MAHLFAFFYALSFELHLFIDRRFPLKVDSGQFFVKLLRFSENLHIFSQETYRCI